MNFLFRALLVLFLSVASYTALAATATNLTAPKMQFFDNNDNPLAGGKIYTYIAGTTSNKTSYTDASEGTPNADPVILDSAGMADIWIDGSYKIVVQDSTGVTISTTDNISSAISQSIATNKFTLFDSTDSTKKIVFDLSPMASSWTETLKMPVGLASFNMTLVGTDVGQTLTNKTMSGSSNTFSNLALTSLATQAANTVVANATAGTAAPTAVALAASQVLGRGTSGNIAPITFGTGLTFSGTSVSKTALANSQATPADPATTTSTTGLMMGLAGAITPLVSGTVEFLVSGDIDNSTASDGAQVQIRYGTGTAPVNGAALTGTAVGGLSKMSNTNSTTQGRYSFSLNAIVTGLTLSTAVWIDVGLAAITGGTARIRDVSITAIEL